MTAVGVRCEKEAITYVLLGGSVESPSLLEHNRVRMRGSSRPEQLQWLRNEIRELITRTGAQVLTFKGPETNAKNKDLGRAECEGVLQEATLSKGLVPLKRVKRQIKADLGFQESGRYLHKALPESLSGLPKNREEAALAALSGLVHA